MEVLSLAGNGISDYGCVELAKGLAVNTSVKTLDLGGNGLGSAGCKAVEMALVSPDKRLSKRAFRATELGFLSRVWRRRWVEGWRILSCQLLRMQPRTSDLSHLDLSTASILPIPSTDHLNRVVVGIQPSSKSESTCRDGLGRRNGGRSIWGVARRK